MDLTHLDSQNKPKMVDVTDKNITHREATASGMIVMSKEAYEAIINNEIKKGPVLQTAVVAAIMGAKKTSELIPMCHPLNIGGVHIDIEELRTQNSFRIYATVSLDGKTGVEMEALTSVSIGLLTIYDMVKAIDKSMVISDMKLVKKSGGKSGEFGIVQRKRLVIGFSGPSNSGKTTLVKKLIERLSPDFKVCAIKHDPKDKAEFDRDGKDSKLFFEAGANVGVLSPTRSTIFRHDSCEVGELIACFGEFDYLFIEGLKHLPLPKIGVFRESIDESYLPFCEALAIDGSVKNSHIGKSVLDLNNTQQILEWIEANAIMA